jgi:hypothetical protein
LLLSNDCTPAVLCEGYYPFSQDPQSISLGTLRLNFHFMKTGNHGLNFGETDGNCPACSTNNQASAADVVQILINEMNYRFANLPDYMLKKDYGVPLIPEQRFKDVNGVEVVNPGDSRIRVNTYEENNEGFVFINEVSEYRYTYHTSLGSGCKEDGFPILPPVSTWIDNYTLYENRVVNIFFFDEWYPESAPSSCRETRGQQIGNNIVIANMWWNWKENGGNMAVIQNFSGIIMHEFGHLLAINHTFLQSGAYCDSDERPYTHPDSDKRWDTSNNIMGYNSLQSAISPYQMNEMLKKLHSPGILYKDIENNNYVATCDKESGLDEIDNGVTVWDEDRLVTRDVIIRSGSKLEITDGACIALARDVKIHIERGAMVYVEDATLKGSCPRGPEHQADPNPPNHWGGFRIAGNSSRDHPDNWYDSFNQDGEDPGRLVLLGATIEDARHAIMMDWDLEYRPDYWGGYTYVDECHFDACHRVAAFMRYRRPNKSKFISTKIQGHGLGEHLRGVGISIWDSYGIEISNCTFESLKPFGVYSINGSAIIENGNKFQYIAGTAVAFRSTANFLGATKVIRIGTEDQNKQRNVFTQNTLGVFISGYSTQDEQVVIRRNDFTGSYNKEDKAIEIINTKINIQDNSINNCYNGISLSDNASILTEVEENVISNFNAGVSYIGSNNLGLFRCNLFNGNGCAGVYVDGSIFPRQGYPTNIFTPTHSPTNQWIRSNHPPGIYDIRVKQRDSELNPNFVHQSVFSYFVEETKPLNSYYRPYCNLTHGIGCDILNDYTVGNCLNDYPCQLILGLNPFEDEVLSAQQLRNMMDSIEIADSFYFYNPEYLELSARKYQLVYSHVDSFFNSQEYSRADSMLAAEPELLYKRMRFGLQLQLANYQAAENILDSLSMIAEDEDDEDFVEVQTHNLAWEQNQAYRPDSTSLGILQDIALKHTPSGGHAVALLSVWNEIANWNWNPYIVKPCENDIQAKPTSNIMELPGIQDINSISYTINPNPGTGIFILNILETEVNEGYYEVELLTLQGSMIESRRLNADTLTIHLDYSGYLPGVYIIRLRSRSGILFTDKIIKTN